VDLFFGCHPEKAASSVFVNLFAKVTDSAIEITIFVKKLNGISNSPLIAILLL